MTTKQLIKPLAMALLFTALGGGAGYWLASQRDDRAAEAQEAMVTQQPSDGRKVLYWYDPMVPNQRFDKPGKSPFMEMQLLPRYADEEAEPASVQIDPRVTQNLGLRLATVERGLLRPRITVVGTVQWNERQVAVVQARAAGFVERVHAHAPGDLLARGAALAELLMPDWAGAQGEFLALKQSGDAELLAAARRRLVWLGMPAELIARVESSGQVQPLFTVTSPIAGVIQSLEVREGMSLAAGMPLARINGFDPVWIEAAVPESAAGQIAVGTAADISLTSQPGRTLAGQVIALLPETNSDSRTARVRIELPNHDGALRPGMFARIDLLPTAEPAALTIPSEAVIRTGTRDLVLLALDGGHFQPAEVRLGREVDGKVVALRGLQEGQRIVASGQFLIDSEASLRGIMARLNGDAAAGKPPAPATLLNEADGTVQTISGNEITLAHGPVKSLGWEAMTMPFQLARPELGAALKVGDRVHFSFRQGDGGFVIEQIDKIGSGP